MSLSVSERGALAALATNLGPEHPTVLPGWNIRELMAHLVVRENRPDAALGIVFKPMAGHLESVEAAYAQRDFHELVAQWAAGPKIYNPVRLLDRAINTIEHFAHHEDVLRAMSTWRPREFSRAEQEELHRAFQPLAKTILKNSKAPVVLEPEGLPRIVVADRRGVTASGDNVAHVSGPIGELILWVFQRETVGVTVDDPEKKIIRGTV